MRYTRREIQDQVGEKLIRGSVKMLLAYSLHPKYWEHERVKQLVDYFLKRDGIFRTTNLNKVVNKDMSSVSFPITWRANVFEILLALSRMGYGNHERLKRAWDVLDEKRDIEGRYILDWTPSQSIWKVGKRKEPNKWITFYANLAHRLRVHVTGNYFARANPPHTQKNRKFF